MTKLCAEAMGYRISDASKFDESGLWCHLPAQHGEWYRPLSGDTYGNAQAMVLVKRFGIDLYRRDANWIARRHAHGIEMRMTRREDDGISDYLNRAVVQCVAKMRA